jgi:hypothetical protein
MQHHGTITGADIIRRSGDQAVDLSAVDVVLRIGRDESAEPGDIRVPVCSAPPDIQA